jgi:mono/diheme cytochrome c family protein
MRIQRSWPLIGGIFLTLSSMLVASCAQKPSGGMTEDWEAPARAAGITNPAAANQGSIAAGKAIYRRECLACHGNMGKGDGPAAIALAQPPSDLSMPMMWEHSDGALFWKITQGRRPMPRFENLLASDERWQVVNYIRTLAAHPKGSGVREESKDMAPMGHMH